MAPCASRVLLSVNGDKVSVPLHDDEPSTRLIDVLRQHTRYKGVKLACGEGGCGACTVQVATYDPATEQVSTRTLNACLAPIGSLDGCAITTAEGLGNSATGYHAIQEEVVKNHGSQCGFCTPGIVMACHGVAQRAKACNAKPTAEDFQQGLDGNLCRCTGWRSIVDACKGLVDVEDLCSKDASSAAFPAWLKRHATQTATAGAAEGAAGAGTAGGAAGLAALEGGRQGQLWLRPSGMDQVWEALAAHPGARLVAGNTGAGVYKNWPTEGVVVDLTRVADLRQITKEADGVVLGGAVSLAELVEVLRSQDVPEASAAAWAKMAEHVERIAGHHVRSAATVGGHFALLRNRPLESDLATVLLAAGTSLQLARAKGSRWVDLEEYLATAFGNAAGSADAKSANGVLTNGNGTTGTEMEVVTAVRITYAAASELFWSHKVALRYYNSHALVNIAFKLAFDHDVSINSGAPSGKITSARVVLGHPTQPHSVKETWRCGRSGAAEKALSGKQLDGQAILGALEGVLSDLAAAGVGADTYHAQALEGLLFQGLAPLVAACVLEASPQLAKLLKGVTASGVPPVVESRIDWSTGDDGGDSIKPLNQPIVKEGARLQASGEAAFTSDVGVGNSKQLYAAVVKASIARGSIKSIDPSPALELPGVAAFVGAQDIPKGGANHTFGCPVFADKEVGYAGQPLGVIVAASRDLAERAAGLVAVEYADVADPLVTIERAVTANSFYEQLPFPAMNYSRGDVDKAMASAKHKITGAKYSLPGQSHFYMETQVSVAEPLEDGCMRIHSGTQSLDAVQASVAGVLGEPFHKITVVTGRVGGAFGGKSTRSSAVAAAAALAARKVGQPVFHALNRNDDFRLNAGRCECEVTYDVGFEEDGTITALDFKVVARGGAFMDLAFVDLMIFITDTNNAYEIPNLRVDTKLVKCNLPPHTIMRSPGFVQAVLVNEQIMEHVAAQLGMDSSLVKQKNFLVACPPLQLVPESAIDTAAAHNMLAAESAGRSDKAVAESAAAAAAAAAGPEPAMTGAESAVAVAQPATAGANGVHGHSSSNGVHGTANGAHRSGKEGALGVDSGADPPVIKRPCASTPEKAMEKGAGQPVNGQATAAPAGADEAIGDAHQSTEPAEATPADPKEETRKLCTLPRVWQQLKEDSGYEARVAEVAKFNAEHVWRKRGIVMTPCKFDAAPPAIQVVVNVYGDGSILVNHGGIEMGQGLATKVKQAVSYQLGQVLPKGLGPLPLDLIRTAPSNSDFVPNGGQTWSSTGSEGNVRAAILACKQLGEQLAPHIKEGDDAATVWRAAVTAVLPDVGFSPSKVLLTGLGRYDGNNEDGSPVAYSAYVGAVSEVEVDLLTGERTVLRADLLYDMGTPLNPALDMGQVEGAFVQGIGMWTCEEVVYDEATGALITDSSWNYKIPTPDMVPRSFNVQLLKDAPNPRGIMSSKASGEPSLLNSTSVLLALQQATRTAMHDLAAAYGTGAGAASNDPTPGAKSGGGAFVPLCAPATPTRIKRALGSFTVASVLRAALGADAIMAPA